MLAVAAMRPLGPSTTKVGVPLKPAASAVVEVAVSHASAAELVRSLVNRPASMPTADAIGSKKLGVA